MPDNPDNPAPELRPAGAGEAERLAALHRQAFGARAWDAQSFARLLKQEGVEALTAFVRGELCGMVLYRQAADEGEILTIAVMPAMRRRGIGGRLLASAMTTMMMQGASRLFLEVAADNAAALALYEQAGFERLGMRPGYYAGADGPGRDAVLMVRYLHAGCGDCDT